MRTRLTRRQLLARTGAAGAGLALGVRGSHASPLSVASAAAAQGQTKDTLVIGLGGDASFINPVVASDGQSYKVEWPVFDALVEYDENLNIRPALAASWDVSEDGQTYTFHLNKTVVWHDGTPFTADDVAFTFYTMLDPKTHAASRAFFGALAGFAELTNAAKPADPASLPKKPVEVLDPYTVRFNLSYPYAAFLGVLTAPRGAIIPKRALQGQDVNTTPFNTKPVGTGPYRVVEWRKGDSIVLEAFDRYYRGRPAIRRVVFRVIPDPVVRTQALRTGGIDLLDDPPVDELNRLKSDPQYTVAGIYTPSYEYFGFRLDRPPFNDVRVRQALSYAVDFDAIVHKVLLGYALPATGPIPPTSWAYTAQIKRYPYDPAQAKRLLSEAGYTPGPGGIMQKDGRPFRFSIKGDEGAQAVRDAAVIVQAQLAQVGVQADIGLLDWPTFVRQLFASDFEVILVGWTGHPDPDPFNYTIWHSSQWNGRNFAHYKNPEVDQILEDGRRTRDRAKRRAAYVKLQQVLATDAPYVWGYYQKEMYVYNRRLRGFSLIPAQAAIYQSLRTASWQS
ncbi:MAG TPA: peptide-binding protein [bacterium]|nr:peptide-binding protein [bacterium]